MSDLGDLVSEFLFWLFAFAIVIGSIGGWIVIVGLIAREQQFKREAAHAALEAASHPTVGRRNAA